jgi:hypothetical protein
MLCQWFLLLSGEFSHLDELGLESGRDLPYWSFVTGRTQPERPAREHGKSYPQRPTALRPKGRKRFPFYRLVRCSWVVWSDLEESEAI